MRQTIALKQNRSLIACFSKAKRKATNWVVFLPESGSEFHSGTSNELKWLLGPKLAARFNYLVINKPGLGPSRTDRKAFEQSFRRSCRVADALTVLNTIVPKGDKIYLIGYSEGAYLAPQVARLDRRVQAVAMIGGGTRGWLKEELNNASKAGKTTLLRQIREIEKNPTSLKKWNGFSYATWYSYRQDNTLKALNRLKLPVLSILGARDRVIDLKSTLQDLSSLAKRQPVRTHLLPTCGHSFAGHWAEVRRALNDFLIPQR